MRKSKLKIIALSSFLTFLLGGAFFIYTRWERNSDPDAGLTLEEAARMGEATTHKLLVQIENPKGRSEDFPGRYERGDIVLIFPAEHGFSLAEKEGFLILRMELTPKQAQILVQALEEDKSFFQRLSKGSNEPSKILKRRRFSVDLQKIGIAPEDERGREIEEQIFNWNIILEK